MSTLPIITADQRLAERRGIKGCIFGKSGIGNHGVETALLADIGDQISGNMTLRQIAKQNMACPALGRDRLGHRFGALSIGPGMDEQHHIRRRQATAKGGADAASRARDQNSPGLDLGRYGQSGSPSLGGPWKVMAITLCLTVPV